MKSTGPSGAQVILFIRKQIVELYMNMIQTSYVSDLSEEKKRPETRPGYTAPPQFHSFFAEMKLFSKH